MGVDLKVMSLIQWHELARMTQLTAIAADSRTRPHKPARVGTSWHVHGGREVEVGAEYRRDFGESADKERWLSFCHIDVPTSRFRI